MSKQKIKKRTWGYEIICRTNTDFMEGWVCRTIESTLKMLSEFLAKKKFRNTKVIWRFLQDDELPK